MDEIIPALVQELANQAKGKPIAWFIAPETVTIVMEDGRKLKFDRAPAPSAAITPPPDEQPKKGKVKRG